MLLVIQTARYVPDKVTQHEITVDRHCYYYHIPGDDDNGMVLREKGKTEQSYCWGQTPALVYAGIEVMHVDMFDISGTMWMVTVAVLYTE